MTTTRDPRHTHDQALCGIIPPHLLASIARSGDERAARAAERTLAFGRRITGTREVRAARSDRPGIGDGAGLIPPHLQRRAQGTSTQPPIEGLGAAASLQSAVPESRVAARRAIYDAQNGDALPGVIVREEGQPVTGDESVDEAYDGLGHTFDLYHEVFGRDSLDDAGMPLVASVHYGQDYGNAVWDGEQMIFGDGDGVYFQAFTNALDVVAHELSHGVVQYTTGFVYVAQPGALNESVCDVFGSMAKQRALGQSAQEADWLIGAEVLTDRVQGVALRSMKAPGTAYDDPALGVDPQPASMDDYKVLPHDADNDNGGVHINSGIPNRAFYLAAVGIGGNSWEGAGAIWYHVLTQGGLAKDCDFVTFAQGTLASADALHGDGSPQRAAVEEAWRTVGVLGVEA